MDMTIRQGQLLPLYSRQTEVEPAQERQLAKRVIEISQIVCKVIIAVGVVLASACVIGIWALPLDMVIYTAGIATAKIPASLLALPILGIIWGFAQLIIWDRVDKKTEAYHKILVDQLIRERDICEVKKELAEFGKDIKKLDLETPFIANGTALSSEALDTLLSASPNLRELSIDAAAMPEGFVKMVIAKASGLIGLNISHAEDLGEKDLIMLSELTQLKYLGLSKAKLIDKSVFKLFEVFEDMGYQVNVTDGRYVISKGRWRSSVSSDGGFVYVGNHTGGTGGGNVTCNFVWR